MSKLKKMLNFDNPEEDKQRYIIEQYKTGRPMDNLAAEVNMSYGTVRNILRRNNISIRPRGGPRSERIDQMEEGEGSRMERLESRIKRIEEELEL